jgi:hypothetical protein
MATTPNPTMGQATAVAGLLDSYAASQMQQTAAIQQQTAYMVQARDTLALAEVRADMDEQYAAVQAGRTLQKADTEARNWQIAGNTLLRNMRKTNAAMRARAAASGVALGSGSIEGVQLENVAATMRDVDIADLNALTARVLGFEDANALIQSTELQNTLNLFAAQRGAGQLETAASAARRTGGMLSNITLARGIYSTAKADPFSGMGNTRDPLADWRRTGSGGD